MPTPPKQPCKGCPFRRKSLRGWLGPHLNSMEITGRVQLGIKFPCHEQVNALCDGKRHLDVDAATVEAGHCIGALQMMNNSFALSRNRAIADQQEEAGTNPDVFEHQGQFADWHDAPDAIARRMKVLRMTKD